MLKQPVHTGQYPKRPAAQESDWNQPARQLAKETAVSFGPFIAVVTIFKHLKALGATADMCWEHLCREQVMMAFTPMITGCKSGKECEPPWLL